MNKWDPEDLIDLDDPEFDLSTLPQTPADIDVDDYYPPMEWEWWDCTYADFIERMEGIGIEVTSDDIQFSGFWSQGDGASFKGTIRDLPKLLRHMKWDEQAPHLYWFAENGYIDSEITRPGYLHNYSHSGTMSVDLWFNSDHAYAIDDAQKILDALEACEQYGETCNLDLREVMLCMTFRERYTAYGEEELRRDGRDFQDFIRGLADELYRELETEYEYQEEEERKQEQERRFNDLQETINEWKARHQQEVQEEPLAA